MKRGGRTFAAMCLAALVSGGLSARHAAAQVLDSTSSDVPGQSLLPGEGEHNRKLRITLDRTNPHACEPLYLVLTAEHFFAEAVPEVMVAKGTGNWQPVSISDKTWMKSEIPGPGDDPWQRIGTVLQLRSDAVTREYLFPSAGEYKLLVKIGSDSTTLTLHVQDPEIGEQEAWDVLGGMAPKVFTNSLDEQPDQAAVDNCGSIARRFPRSVCAKYCTAYLDISRFKLIFNQSGKTGGVAAYGAVTTDLAKDNEVFKGTFFGELTGFYAAYSTGLTHKFKDLLSLAEGVKTHFTPYSDALAGMRLEVMSHLTPQVIPVDPVSLPPATQSATKP